ncbi:MAG: SMP-30/gluconolactonase/LRE family protein [Rubrobacteraceae bacterium]
MPETQTLMTGLVVGESPRWREGRLWFSNWGAAEIIAVDSEGNSEVMARVPTTIPFCFDWLPDGRMLVVSGPEARLLRMESDGSFVTHADLSSLAEGFNEIVVDGRGNAYVNGGDFDFETGEGAESGVVALVRPDGEVRRAAEGIAFGNGMAVTPDNSTLIVAESWARRLAAFDIAPDGALSNRRVWADLGDDPPDGICLDAEGVVWYATVPNKRCARVREGGEVLQSIETDLACFACMLGGEDGKTLLIVAAEWRGVENMNLMFESHTGQVLTARAPAPRVGWP